MWQVVARGNFSLCLEAAIRLLAPRDDASWHPACARGSTNGLLPGGVPSSGGNLPCGADGMPTPALKGEFLATENFFYTVSIPSLLDSSGPIWTLPALSVLRLVLWQEPFNNAAEHQSGS